MEISIIFDTCTGFSKDQLAYSSETEQFGLFLARNKEVVESPGECARDGLAILMLAREEEETGV